MEFRMKTLVLSLSLALAQMLAVSAFAQTKGEADPAQSKAIPSAPATAAEKAAAKAARKAEGTKAVKEEEPADATNKSMGVAKVATKAERKAAAQKRKAEVAPAVKKGQIPSGEK
jgi:hypothetical protein